MYRFALLLHRHVMHQALSRRAFILVIFSDINKGTPVKLALGPVL
jgi:hypothetical protein